jgi:hypothetical protein
METLNLNLKYSDIISAKVCPYCGETPEFVDSSCVYHGNSFGMIYLCRKCNSYVGVHAGTKKAKGRLADAELRKAKQDAHRAFDKIAKTGLINKLWKQRIPNTTNREKAYWWLSRKMGVKKEFCHIGMFDLDQCAKVISICQMSLNKLEKRGVVLEEYLNRICKQGR